MAVITDYDVMRELTAVRTWRWGWMGGDAYIDGSDVRHPMPNVGRPIEDDDDEQESR